MKHWLITEVFASGDEQCENFWLVKSDTESSAKEIWKEHYALDGGMMYETSSGNLRILERIAEVPETDFDTFKKHGAKVLR